MPSGDLRTKVRVTRGHDPSSARVNIGGATLARTVLRIKSEHPVIAANRDLIHKIGVTNMPVEQRIAGARLQPTFLMADVEVATTYKLYNIGRTKLEKLIHRVFDPARLDMEIKDRFGQPIVPREWFLVPLFVIRRGRGKIKDGTISNFVYDPKLASLVEISTSRAKNTMPPKAG
jgi:hypothetical protein